MGHGVISMYHFLPIDSFKTLKIDFIEYRPKEGVIII